MPQEGGVIKTAPKTTHDAQHHHNLSPKLELPNSVPPPHIDLVNPTQTLQDLQTMRPTYSDPYANPATSVYATRTVGGNEYGYPIGLAAQPTLLQNTAHLSGIPPYSIVPQPQDLYSYNPAVRDQSYAAIRPAPSFSYADEELIARSGIPIQSLPQPSPVNLPHSSAAVLWDPAVVYSTPRSAAPLPPHSSAPSLVYKQGQMDMQQVSPVDSGIGPDMIVTPSKDGSASAVADQHFPSYSNAPGRSSVEASTISTNRDSPVRIPKLDNQLGFQYTLEAPISTSVRKDDDRMTYINKGQFYCVSLDYYHDPEKLLRSPTVRSVLMVVFREEKAEEEELKSWQFWHSRQHSVKQRILDVDTNNSSGVLGKVEEVSHNAVQFAWNPMEQSVKLNVAVHCLSTDFSNQKGVKGFPLHIQVDTFDDAIDQKLPFHRGYCQVKVFCDKGANRKMLHEARRDEKRRLQVAGRKKSDAEYHEPCDRSEFYHMSNLDKPSVLFTPGPELDAVLGPVDASCFYALDAAALPPPADAPAPGPPPEPIPLKRPKLYPNDRVLIYVRKPEEPVFQPLHLHPPTVDGLIQALADKYPDLPTDHLAGLFKHSRKGVHVKIDDAMVKHYSNEDTYLLQLSPASPADAARFNLTLQEILPPGPL